MTTCEKQLVRQSFEVIRSEAGPLSLLFYGRLFELDPRLRPMFHGDIRRQGLKLMQMIAAAVEGLDDLEALTPVLHALGQRHVSYGVVAQHYDLVAQALVWALTQALEALPDSDVISAWRTLIGEVSARMLEGADLIVSPSEAVLGRPADSTQTRGRLE